jgi:DNA-directed RNA polymerase specialized sigma24 family protein
MDNRSKADSLVGAMVAGDTEAFRQLFTQLASQTLRLLMAHIRVRQIAEELNQELWLLIWNCRDQFDSSQGPFVAWCGGIAMQVVRMHQKSSDRREVRFDHLGMGATTHVGYGRVRWSEAFQHLDLEERQAIADLYIGGYALAEIAERQGCSTMIAVERIKNATQHLRVLLS